MAHAAYRLADEDGLVEDRFDAHAGRGGGADIRQALADAVNDVHSGGAAEFEDGNHHRVLAVEAGDVGADRLTVANVGHIP